MPYPLATTSWDQEEIEAIEDIINLNQFTMGQKVEQFEKEFAAFFNCTDAVMVSNGSAANLLMLALLKYKHRLTGDIIVPTVSWSTTYFPVNQMGFQLNFVDIDPQTLNIDPEKIEAAITPSTCAIFAVNLLGNPCQYQKILDIAKRHNLILIEDNCESFGAIAENNRYTGTLGQLGSFSFFFSHHIQTMEGGMITCHSSEDAEYLRSLRAHGWSRHLSTQNSITTLDEDPFKRNFCFVTPGFNVRPLEMAGAIGSVQLKKWPTMLSHRRANAEYIQAKATSPFFRLQQETGQSSWFGFSIILQDLLKGHRHTLIQKLSQHQIETRPIVAGNFLKQPVIKQLDYIAQPSYDSADDIDENGFFIGNHNVDLSQKIDLFLCIINDFIEENIKLKT